MFVDRRHRDALAAFDAAGERGRAIGRDIARAELALVLLRDQLAAANADRRAAFAALADAPDGVWSVRPPRPVAGLEPG